MACITVFCVVARAENHAVVPLTRAHSHNDYEQKRPLETALECGFNSVEADTFLIDGDLLVGHNLKDLKPERNLRAMYLDPLQKRVKANGGHVYPNGGEFILLIDIKDNGEKNYARLREMLHGYEDMLTSFTDTKTTPGAVTIILSGGRPTKMVASESNRLVALDGRPRDLENLNPNLFPLVSEDYFSLFKWLGVGEMPEAQKKALADIVKRTHEAKAKLRFYGVPSPSTLWPIFYDAGVDLLNADDLPALRDMLLKRQAAAR